MADFGKFDVFVSLRAGGSDMGSFVHVSHGPFMNLRTNVKFVLTEVLQGLMVLKI